MLTIFPVKDTKRLPSGPRPNAISSSETNPAVATKRGLMFRIPDGEQAAEVCSKQLSSFATLVVYYSPMAKDEVLIYKY